MGLIEQLGHEEAVEVYRLLGKTLARDEPIFSRAPTDD
jgi:hypothetical protein